MSELDPVIDRILAENEAQVAAYRGGKEGLLGFFVGAVMRETEGKANPKVVNERLREAERVIPDTATLGVFVAAALALLLVPGPAVLYVVARSIDQARGGTRLGARRPPRLARPRHGRRSRPLVAARLVRGGVQRRQVRRRGVSDLSGRARTDDPRGATRRRSCAASKGRLLRRAVVNILNPKTALFFLAFLPQFVDPDAGYVGAQLVFFGLVFVALGLVTDSSLCARRGDRRRLAPHEQRLRRCAAVGLGHGLHRPRSRDRALRFSTEDVTSSSRLDRLGLRGPAAGLEVGA